MRYLVLSLILVMFRAAHAGPPCAAHLGGVAPGFNQLVLSMHEARAGRSTRLSLTQAMGDATWRRRLDLTERLLDERVHGWRDRSVLVIAVDFDLWLIPKRFVPRRFVKGSLLLVREDRPFAQVTYRHERPRVKLLN